MEDLSSGLGDRYRYVAYEKFRMGHELTIYGIIEGATASSDDYRRFQRLNEEVIKQLPNDDEWPWLVRDMFQFPAMEPIGTYQTQIIHFGLSMKDGVPLENSDNYDPIKNWRNPCRDSITGWIEKFEKLLSKMYWIHAAVHVNTDFEPERKFSYIISRESIELMCQSDNPQPVTDWELSVIAT